MRVVVSAGPFQQCDRASDPVGAGQLPCPDGDHCEPKSVHGDGHQHEGRGDRAALDLVVAEERARGVREPGHVPRRPDEGDPGSRGYGPDGREGGAAAGVQPAGPRVSLHAGSHVRQENPRRPYCVSRIGQDC
jgi:hypothetical protein